MVAGRSVLRVPGGEAALRDAEPQRDIQPNPQRRHPVARTRPAGYDKLHFVTYNFLEDVILSGPFLFLVLY